MVARPSGRMPHKKGDEAPPGSARPQELQNATPAAAADPHLSAARVSGAGPPYITTLNEWL